MAGTAVEVAAPRRTVTEVTLEMGRLIAGEAVTTVHTPLTRVQTTLRWPGDDLLRGWNLLAAGGAPAADGLDLGIRLFESAFADPRALRAFHDAAAGNGFLRLRIRTSDRALSSLPWELLADPTRREFLGRSGSVVRWLDPDDAVPTPVNRSPTDRTIRALVVGASPPEAPLPGLDRELAAIRAVYEEGARRGVAEPATVLRDATRRDLADALREAIESGRPYDVLHLSCHAGVPQGYDHPVLHLLGEDGMVSPEGLARLVADSPPRLVVLNACASLAADGSGARAVGSGFADALLRRGVPAIVGMGELVADSFAATVGGDLHQALLDGRTVDGAVTDVRRLVEDRTAAGHAHFGIPVVYLAPGPDMDRLVRPPSDDEDRPPWRRWLREHRWVSTLVVVVIPTAITYLTVGQALIDRVVGDPPPRMFGDFNLAVAEFGSGDDVHPDLAGLDESIAAQLEEGLCGAADPDGLQVDCLGPDAIGAVSQADAAALTGDLNAHVLVHGALEGEGDAVTLHLLLTVGESDLGRAPDLVGSHTVGDITGSDLGPTERAEFRRRAEAQARGLRDVVFALAQYADGDFAAALARIRATQGFDLDPALPLLLEGNIHGRLGDLAAAEDAYRRAAEVEPDDPHAVLGLAEVAYQRGTGDGSCAAGRIDAARLAEAEERYTEVAGLADPADALAATSGTFGVARVQTCRSAAGLADEWDVARTGFEEVVADHAAHPDSLRDTTAEAHSFLAFLAGREARWDDVIDHANAALALDPAGADRRSHFLQLRAEAEGQIGRTEEACASLAEARDGATAAQLRDITTREELWRCE